MAAEMSAQDYDSFGDTVRNIIKVNVVSLIQLMVLLVPKILLICGVSIKKHC